MDADRTSTHEIDSPEAEVIDSVNVYIRRWEHTLRKIDPQDFQVSLRDASFARGGFAADHLIVFGDHRGERRLLEIEGSGTLHTERLLVNAARSVRVEALRRLPRAVEGAIIRRQHSTG